MPSPRGLLRRLPPDGWALVALTALATVPVLSSRYLPLFDYAAHLVVPAALRWRGDPASGVAQLYELDPGLYPNSAHYAFTWLASYVVPLETAARLFVALFCVAALPPAVAFALKTFGRDWRLAVLAVPLTYGRGLFYGFVGFCAALPVSLAVVSLAKRDLDAPSVRRKLLLGAACLALPFCHFFVMLVTVGLAAALVAGHARRHGARSLLTALPLAAGPLAMVPWFLSSLGRGPRPEGGLLAHVLESRLDLHGYAQLLMHWFMDGYYGHGDEALAVLMVVTLAALHGLGRLHGDASAVAPATGRAPLWLAGLLALGFVALPFEILRPFHWWAMNVRLLPLLYLWLVVATPPGALLPRGRLVLAPVALATAAYLGFVAWDFRATFNGPRESQGLEEVVAALPPGARVLGLYTDMRAPLHYSHYPYHYAACYAVVERGGQCGPFIPIPQAWTNPREVPPHPVAGDAAFFRFEWHGAGWSHFLVWTCEGWGCVPDPLAGRPEVSVLLERGRWRLYGRALPAR